VTEIFEIPTGASYVKAK